MTTSTDLRKQITDLAAHQSEHSYSVLMPTHRTHPENEQDPIRWKNALEEVRSELSAAGMRGIDIERILKPLRDRLDDRSFWQHRQSGFAAFGSPETGPIEIELPVRLDAEVRVGNRFHFRPLLAALEDQSLPTLVLARGGAAMYEVDHDGAWRMDVDLPASTDDVNWFVDREPRLQQRAQPTFQAGFGYHGHPPDEDQDEDLRRYLAAVAAVVTPLLDDRRSPLAVSAPGDLSARFQRLVDHEVIPVPAVDPEGPGSQIAEAVTKVREDVIDRRREAIRRELSAGHGRGAAIDDLEEALIAGLDSRIDTLGLVVDADPVWGVIDESTRTVEIHDVRQEGDADLLDRLAGFTLMGSGRVEPLQQPLQSRVFVALPRY